MEHILRDKITEILRGASLPKMADVLNESNDIAKSITITPSSFMKKYDVTSELEYKKRCVKEGRIMYHAHIGMNTWQETACALNEVYKFAEANSFRLDRA